MTEYTCPATWDDIKRLATCRSEAGVEYALAAHGISRLPDGAAREMAAAPDVFAGQHRYAIRIDDEFSVGVLPSIAGHGRDEMRAHMIERDLDGVRVRLLDREGRLETKQGVRPRDPMDARAIRAVLDALRQDPGT